MPAIQGLVNFNPKSDIPSLDGKVIFVTGATAGIGAETVRHLAAHNPAHIYFSGRNAKAGSALTSELSKSFPNVGSTFVEMDLSSLAAVKSAVHKNFNHSRLDILVNNAGIMAQPATLSKDGYEIQFATNHLGHAMLTKQLLPTLLRTAELPNSDVRVVTLSSLAFSMHSRDGIEFDKLDSSDTMQGMFGKWRRYGHSKFANVLFATELARRCPQITSVSIHPGVVRTPLTTTQPWYNRALVNISQLKEGGLMEPHQGAWNSVWAAAAGKKEKMRNGGFYLPVGHDGWNDTLDNLARDKKLAAKLWDWTEDVLAKF